MLILVTNSYIMDSLHVWEGLSKIWMIYIPFFFQPPIPPSPKKADVHSTHPSFFDLLKKAEIPPIVLQHRHPQNKGSYRSNAQRRSTDVFHSPSKMWKKFPWCTYANTLQLIRGFIVSEPPTPPLRYRQSVKKSPPAIIIRKTIIISKMCKLVFH